MTTTYLYNWADVKKIKVQKGHKTEWIKEKKKQKEEDGNKE